jgi:hypothetical protein
MDFKKAFIGVDDQLTVLKGKWTQCFNEFKSALELQNDKIEILNFDSQQIPAANTSPFTKIPHILFFKKDDSRTKELNRIFSFFRSADPSVGIIVISDSLATGKDTMKWLDLGATALISTESSSSHLKEAIRELFASRILNHSTRDLRVPAKHKVVLHISSLEQAIVSETLNLGLGGAFLRVVPQGIKVGDIIEFELLVSKTVSDQSANLGEAFNPLVSKMNSETNSNQDKISRFSGKGSVAWVRTTPSPTGHEGIGVHFTELDSSTKTFILDFVKTHGFKSFIPQT